MTAIYTVTYCMLCHEVIEVNSSDEEQHIASYSRSGQDLTVSCENKVRRQQDKFRGFQKQRDTSISYLRHFKTASNYKTTMQCSIEALISKTTFLNNTFETQLESLACFYCTFTSKQTQEDQKHLKWSHWAMIMSYTATSIC